MIGAQGGLHAIWCVLAPVAGGIRLVVGVVVAVFWYVTLFVGIVLAVGIEDEFWEVREMAICELAKGWPHESWMFDFLSECVRNDPYERMYPWHRNPRHTTLRLLVHNYPDDDRIKDLLTDRAQNDKDKQVSSFAKEKLENL